MDTVEARFPGFVDDVLSEIAEAPLFEVGVVVFLAVLLLLALLMLLVGAVYLRYSYLIRKSEGVPAGEAWMSEGLVEVEGEARPFDGEKLVSKYTDRRVLAHDWRKRRLKDEGWSTVSSGRDAVPFRVVDGTGEVVVDPEGASLQLGNSRVDGSKKKIEGSLEPGDEVQVIGEKRSVVERREGLGTANHYVGGTDSPVFKIVAGDESVSLSQGILSGVVGVVLGALGTVGIGFVLLSRFGIV